MRYQFPRQVCNSAECKRFKDKYQGANTNQFINFILNNPQTLRSQLLHPTGLKTCPGDCLIHNKNRIKPSPKNNPFLYT